MTGDALFDMPDAEQLRAEKAAYDALGADAKRTVRNNRMIAGGVHPTTKYALLRDRPEDERALLVLSGVNVDATCADCRFCVSESYHTRSYIKCKAVAQTHGPGSDTRKKWPACTKFQPRRLR